MSDLWPSVQTTPCSLTGELYNQDKTIFIQMVTWCSNIVCGTTVHYSLQKSSHIVLIVTMATQMSWPSGQTTNCSLIGDTLLVAMAIPGAVQPGLAEALVLGQCLHVRKDNYQHQTRFHWRWSSLRHHSHFTTTANFRAFNSLSSVYIPIPSITPSLGCHWC